MDTLGSHRPGLDLRLNPVFCVFDYVTLTKSNNQDSIK